MSIYGGSNLSTLRILPLSSHQAIGEIKALSGGRIIACDFYITDIERIAAQITGGFQFENVITIDHHAPIPEMARVVSSTNLAMEFVAENGIADADTTVVLNHTDCDSVLSSAIVLGILDPLPVIGEAAIAADHTGVANDIADMLQGLDASAGNQSREQAGLEKFDFAVRNVKRLLDGEPLEEAAREALMKQRERRALAANLVKGAAFTQSAGLAFGMAPSKIKGAFLPALLPDAVVILLATPADGEKRKWRMKARLGNAAPPGLTLFDLHLDEYDPTWGGRWNAGSNARGVGGDIDPQVYAKEVRRRLAKALEGCAN